MDKGFFFVLDGIDGCGSTTHTKLLGEYLSSLNYSIYLTREPSDFGVGKLLRAYLKNESIPIPTDALLFAADRVEHFYNEILPKINLNNVVISDRYLESSIAYQVAQTLYERQINKKSEVFEISIDWVETINKFAPEPDLTIILDIEPKTSIERKYSLDEAKDKFENIEFLEIVRSIYLERAKSKNFKIIDVNKPIEEVRTEINKEVIKFLK